MKRLCSQCPMLDDCVHMDDQEQYAQVVICTSEDTPEWRVPLNFDKE